MCLYQQLEPPRRNTNRPQAFTERKWDNLPVTFILVKKVAAMLFQVSFGRCCGAVLQFGKIMPISVSNAKKLCHF